jgi:uncharacterized membrane protein YphA (DoxX/SURF4 family)
LKRDLDAQTAAFKKALADTLTPEQKKKREADVRQEAARQTAIKHNPASAATEPAQLPPDPLVEPIPRPTDWNRPLDRSDAVVKWSLIVVGIGLIAGCFTRLAALAGAALLLSFYLAMPALPYLPESPKAEGHYVYINKNIIEMIALLALVFLPTGRWAGLDGLLQFLNPFRWSKPQQAEPPPVAQRRFEG